MSLGFEVWCRMIRRDRVNLEDIHFDADAFTALVAGRSETAPDISAAEAALPPSRFSREVRRLLEERGNPAVVCSIWNKPASLRRLSEDPDPLTAAAQWVTISRGWFVVQPGTDIPASAAGNYVAEDDDLAPFVDKELQRQEAAHHLGDWNEIAAEHGISDLREPLVFIPIGAFAKETDSTGATTKARVFNDPGPSGINDATPDELAHTKLARVEDAEAAMSSRSPFWRTDYSDAFLHHALARGQPRYCGLRWRGRVMALRRMGLGFRAAPRQMQQSHIAIIRSFHRELRARGLPTGPDPDFHVRPPRTTPGRGHRHTATPGYVDDAAGFTTSRLAAWYSFATWVHVTSDPEVGWAMPLSFAKGKTCSPNVKHIFLGFSLNALDMSVAIPALKQAKYQALIRAFLAREDSSTYFNRVGDAQSLGGVLQHCAHVLPMGIAAYYGLFEAVYRLGRRPPKRARICCEPSTLEGIALWDTLFERIPARSAITGIRRRRFWGACYSDASLFGWGWHCAATSEFDSGVWPRHWRHLIDPLSEFREVFITELEAIAVLLCLRRVVRHAVGTRITFYCDNLGVVMMLRRHTTRSKRIRPIVNEIVFLCCAYDVELHMLHVRTEYNTFADVLSREITQVITRCPVCGDVFATEHAQQVHWFQQHRAHPASVPAVRAPPRPELLPATPILVEDTFPAVLADGDIEELRSLLPAYAAGDPATTLAPPAFTLLSSGSR